MKKEWSYKIIVTIVALIALGILANIEHLSFANNDASLEGYAVYAPIGKEDYAPQKLRPTVETLKGITSLNQPDLAVIDIKLEKVKMDTPSASRKYLMVPVIKNLGRKTINTDLSKGGRLDIRMEISIDGAKVLRVIPQFYLEPGQTIALPYEYDLTRIFVGHERPATTQKKVTVEVMPDRTNTDIFVQDYNKQNNRLDKYLDFR